MQSLRGGGGRRSYFPPAPKQRWTPQIPKRNRLALPVVPAVVRLKSCLPARLPGSVYEIWVWLAASSAPGAIHAHHLVMGLFPSLCWTPHPPPSRFWQDFQRESIYPAGILGKGEAAASRLLLPGRPGPAWGCLLTLSAAQKYRAGRGAREAEGWLSPRSRGAAVKQGSGAEEQRRRAELN